MAAITQPTLVNYQGGADLRGTLLDIHNRPVAGQPVQLFQRTPGTTAWVHVVDVRTTSAGVYVLLLRKLTKTMDYQVRFAGSPIDLPSAAPAFRLTVRPAPHWARDTALATDTEKAINAYRAAKGLRPMTHYVYPGTDMYVCMHNNVVGIDCTAGLLSTSTTAPAVLASWKMSAFTNEQLIDPSYDTIECAAYSYFNAANVKSTAFVGCTTYKYQL